MLRITCTFAVLAVVFAVSPALAALFTVTSASDLTDVAPGDGVCDANPSGPVVCTLRAAVQEANALAGADVISLPAGDYSLTLAGIEDQAASGDLDINSVISITGAGPGVTTIDQTTGDRVFEVWFPPSALTLVDVTVSGGDVGTAIGSLGGGIRSLSATTLVGVHITGNAARLGAGIYNYGTMQIAESVIDGNQASERMAGIASASTASSGGPATNLTIVSSTIGPNLGPGGAPTEIEFGNGDFATVLDSTIAPADPNVVAVEVANENVELNHVTLRGGIRTFSFDGSHTLTISNSVVEWCAFNGAQQPVIERLGANASTDASCGFAAAGGIEGPFGLGALADNGGLSPTYLPQPGSALIDAASTGVCRATDQRGIARPQGAACDIGAVEVVPESGAIGAALASIASLAWLRRRS
jgi:CSLREA domain-containing protein